MGPRSPDRQQELLPGARRSRPAADWRTSAVRLLDEIASKAPLRGAAPGAALHWRILEQVAHCLEAATWLRLRSTRLAGDPGPTRIIQLLVPFAAGEALDRRWSLEPATWGLIQRELTLSPAGVLRWTHRPLTDELEDSKTLEVSADGAAMPQASLIETDLLCLAQKIPVSSDALVRLLDSGSVQATRTLPSGTALGHLAQSRDGQSTDLDRCPVMERLGHLQADEFRRWADQPRLMALVSAITARHLATADRAARWLALAYPRETVRTVHSVGGCSGALARYLGTAQEPRRKRRHQAVRAYPGLPWNWLPEAPAWETLRAAVDHAERRPTRWIPPGHHFRCIPHLLQVGAWWPLIHAATCPVNPRSDAVQRTLARLIEGAGVARFGPEVDWPTLLGIAEALSDAGRTPTFLHLEGLIDRPATRLIERFYRYNTQLGFPPESTTAVRWLVRGLVPFLTELHLRLNRHSDGPAAVADRDASLVTWLRRTEHWLRELARLEGHRIMQRLPAAQGDARAWRPLATGLLVNSVAADCGEQVGFAELLDRTALEREGAVMGHCVRRYAPAGYSGEMRFFRLEGAHEVSTLAVTILGEPFYLELGEHRGAGNAAPGAAHRQAAKSLLRLLFSEPRMPETVEAILRDAWLVRLPHPSECSSNWAKDLDLQTLWGRFRPCLPGTIRSALRRAIGE